MAKKKMLQRSAGKADLGLGQRIRLRRTEMKMSQDELGSRLGVSFQQVQEFENGVNRGGAARLQKFAAALEVPITFFYDDNDNKKRMEVQSLLFLDAPFMMRLLRAYSKVEDLRVQRNIVSLIESIAGEAEAEA